MDGFSLLQSGAQIRLSSRSMGLKLLVVCALAVFMTIPALFVMGLVGERTERAADVVREISGYSGGQQSFLGPTLAVPYKIAPDSSTNVSKRNTYLIFPAVASAVVETAAEERHRFTSARLIQGAECAGSSPDGSGGKLPIDI